MRRMRWLLVALAVAMAVGLALAAPSIRSAVDRALLRHRLERARSVDEVAAIMRTALDRGRDDVDALVARYAQDHAPACFDATNRVLILPDPGTGWVSIAVPEARMAHGGALSASVGRPRFRYSRSALAVSSAGSSRFVLANASPDQTRCLVLSFDHAGALTLTGFEDASAQDLARLDDAAR